MKDKIITLIESLIYLADKEKRTIKISDVKYKKIIIHLPVTVIEELKEFIENEDRKLC